MKRPLMIILLVAGLQTSADDLYTKDGSVYRNVRLVSADPVRMLIVYDGGGCQVNHADLKPETLTPALRKQIEELLVEHAALEKRREELRLAKEAFDLAQREKGLVQFEGEWMAPLEREKILLMREKEKLERERQQIELAKQKEELRRQELETERARDLLEGQPHAVQFVDYSSSHVRWPNHCNDRLPDPNACNTYGYVPKLRQRTYPSACNTWTSGPFYNTRSTSAHLNAFNR